MGCSFSIVNVCQKIIRRESKGRCKPNKVWVDQGGEFYNKLFKRWKINEGKSFIAESFIRTLKNKNFKHMAAISKNVYFDVLDNIANKYNNTVHRSIKMKPIDVTSDSYAEYNENYSVTRPEFKGGDRARISKYKSVSAKGYTQNRSGELFIISKIKNPVPWTYVISDINGEPIAGSFYEKELQKASPEKSRI